MRWFNNLKMGRKLFAVFALLTLFVITMGGSALREIACIGNAADDLARIRMPGIQNNGEIRYFLAARRTIEYMHILSNDADEKKGFEA